MIYNLRPFRKLILGLSLSEAEFKARGFEGGYPAQARLELVAKTVVNGYNVAVEHGLGSDLQANRAFVDNELAGFFNEGVGMGLYALDLFSVITKNRFWDFIKEEGKNHEYMSYIGAGLASGVFKIPFQKFLEKASPMSGSLILDGIGFYYAYFKPKKTITSFFVPGNVRKDAFFLERFDNGIGRALWFYNAGEPTRIAQLIHTFPEKRQAALWSGIGLAATYAQGVPLEKVRRLKELAGPHQLMLAQGSILAVHTRHTAGNPHEDDAVCQILVGKSSIECHLQALEEIDFLANRRYVDGQHSFQVFLDRLRGWVHAATKETLVSHQ